MSYTDGDLKFSIDIDVEAYESEESLSYFLVAKLDDYYPGVPEVT